MVAAEALGRLHHSQPDDRVSDRVSTLCGAGRVQLGPNPSTEIDQSASTQQGVEETVVDSGGVVETQPGGFQGLLSRFSAENSLVPNMLMMAGMVILVFLMMRALRRTSQANKVRANSMGSPSERIAEIHQRAEQSMGPSEKLMVDAEAMARRLGAVLDNKAARLELLIEEADMKLDQLNRAMNRTDAPVAHPQADATERPRQPMRTLDPSVLDRARLEQDQQERETRVAGRIAPDHQSREAAEPPEISISDQIQELALQGKSSKEIANELEQPIGQVELILNLRRRAENS